MRRMVTDRVTYPRSPADILLNLVEPFAEYSAVFPEIQIDPQQQSGHADAIGPERAAGGSDAVQGPEDAEDGKAGKKM